MKSPRRASGFTLVELLVALAVFATMAALAYGGLNSIARTRGDLGKQEDRFRDLTRAITTLNRDLGESVARPVRATSGQQLPAMIGTSTQIEFTRLGFANPQAEQRSNLERVVYEGDANTVKRGRYAVLDRMPDTEPTMSDLKISIDAIRLRYLNGGQWLDAWPPQRPDVPLTLLPTAVQWTIQSRDYGELQGVVQLVSQWPTTAAGSPTGGSSPGTSVTPVTPAPGTIK